MRAKSKGQRAKGEGKNSTFRPAVFLDRDGTLCREKHYLHRWEDWEWLPGAARALKGFQRLGFKLVVISNQSGIARGYYSERSVRRLHAAVKKDLLRKGIMVEGFYYCPHHPRRHGVCRCRKPHPGMLKRAARELHLDLRRSFMIGDKAIDVRAGRAAGAVSILVLTGYGRRERKRVSKSVWVVDDLHAAYEKVKNDAKEDVEGC
jgi:D-glycero-D-manno-heptose 1,7-bisphosphate phosphatase